MASIFKYDAEDSSAVGLAPSDAAMTSGNEQAEQLPAPSQAKFDRLFESSIMGIIVADIHGNITEANDFFLRLLGYTPDDLPLRWDAMTPPEWRGLDQSKITELQTTGEGAPWEKEYLDKDGRRVPVLVGVAFLEETDDMCVAVVLDLTERKQSERRLAERGAQLQALAAELVLTEERERRRIARGLHGNIGHALATARMKLGVLQQTEGSLAEESINEIRALLDAAIDATRSLTFELSSPVLYELGVEAALKSLGKKTEAEHGVRFRFETDGQPKSMAENTGIVLYRIARELLFNIVKHAHAESTCLRVEREGDNFRLTLTDDGVGFDAARLGSNFDKAGGFGLFNIRQQLDVIGGSIDIESSHRNGTRVVVMVPLA